MKDSCDSQTDRRQIGSAAEFGNFICLGSHLYMFGNFDSAGGCWFSAGSFQVSWMSKHAAWLQLGSV